MPEIRVRCPYHQRRYAATLHLDHDPVWPLVRLLLHVSCGHVFGDSARPVACAYPPQTLADLVLVRVAKQRDAAPILPIMRWGRTPAERNCL